MLGMGEKIRYHDNFDQIPQYRYCSNNVEITVGTLRWNF